jgi:hypothetical protein
MQELLALAREKREICEFSLAASLHASNPSNGGE